MHKILFTWFDNLPTSTKLQGFHYYQEKYKVRQYSFSLTQKIITRNPNHQNNVFYILRTRFTMDYKTGQKIFLKALPPDLSRSTHRLSLRKSPIKNHTTLFQIGSSSESNTIRLHKAQQISHLETSSITNINRKPPKNSPSLQLNLLSSR